MKDGEHHVKDLIRAWYSAYSHPGFLKLFQILRVCVYERFNFVVKCVVAYTGCSKISSRVVLRTGLSMLTTSRRHRVSCILFSVLAVGSRIRVSPVSVEKQAPGNLT